MNEKGGPTTFAILVLLLILGDSGVAQNAGSFSQHDDTFARPYPVSLNRCPDLPVSPNYCSFVSREGLNSTLDDGKKCTFTLPQYACGFVNQDSNMTSGELSSILQCYVTDPKSQIDQEAFLLLFGRVDTDTLKAALDEISLQIPMAQFTPMARSFLLNAAWEKLKSDPQIQSTGYVASWFQETLHSYLMAIDSNILDCATKLPVTCDGFITIVQALDSAFSRMDNRTRQLVANWIGRFLIIHECQASSAKEWIQSTWKSFLNYASYSDLTKAWSGFDGFSALDVLTASQLAQLTIAQNVLSNTNHTEAVAQALSSQDVRYTEDYLNELSLLPLDGQLEHEAMYVLLETVLRKVHENFPDLCSPSLKDLFQVKLKRLLPVADAKILELFPTKIGCTDFQDIYKGINSVYQELTPTTQKAVYEHRLSFLEGQLTKEGVACTFATSNSRDWLQENFGLSSRFADYETFVHLNPAFNGFEVLDWLTAKQIGALVVVSGLLSDGIMNNAETEAANVMRTLQSLNISELQICLQEIKDLSQQRNMKEITNVAVRNIMLQGILRILKPHFTSMVVTDVESWFGGILTLYLPSITIEELNYLPSPFNCTQLQVMVKGIDYAFEWMSLEMRTGVANWIVKGLQKTDCKTTGDWVNLNFLRFKSFVKISDLMAIDGNFTGLTHLEDLTAVQLAQLTMTEEVFGSMENMDLIFNRLTHLPSLSDLADYWDEFNVVYEKPTLVNVVNISMEVKGLMLVRTMKRLHVEFAKFTDADYQLWFQKRLVVVLPTVTSAVLHQIPLSLSCEAFKSVIAGINVGFSEIPEQGKKDVSDYIVSFLTQKSQITGPACSTQSTTRDWLLQFFGRFSIEVPFVKLVSYYRQTFDAYAVLDILTPTQIGDMMVHSDTLTSMDLAKRLLTFFQESDIDYVRIILKEFTKAAIKHKLTVLPNTEIAELLLSNYLTLMSSQMEVYTAAEWNATLQMELHFFIPLLSPTILDYFIPQDYASFTTIIAGFSDAHPQMTESSRRAVVLWIVQNLKSLKGYPVEPLAEWIRVAWGSFFSDATLEEVKATNENFDPLLVLSFLSARQLVEFVVTSDALVNVTTMNKVLLSLETKPSEIPLAKMDEFLTQFNLVIEQGQIQGLNDAKVRQEMLNIIFTNLAHYFYKFTAEDYQAWFGKKLTFLLPGINENLLQLIPLNVAFPSFRAIFGGFDLIYPELPQETSFQIYSLIKKVMEYQLNVSGTAFSGTYNNSQSFLQLIFHRFVHFATYSDFLTLYTNFNGYEVLSLLSPKQMGQMIVLTKAFKDELKVAQILVEVKKYTSLQLRDFMIEFNIMAKEKRLPVLPDIRIRDLMFKTVFGMLPFSSFSAEQYSFWFGAQLQLLLPSLTPKYLKLIPFDIDCQSHQNLVKAMDEAYEHFTVEQKKAVHERIFSYLESYKADQGITCSPNANSTQWLHTNYGRFSAFGSIQEFLSLNVNFNGVSAMVELSASQLAEVAVASGALVEGNSIVEIMGNLNTVEALTTFLDKLNSIAAVELQSSVHAGSILSIAFTRLAAEFPRFDTAAFKYWFQVAFQNLLHAVNETQMAEIPIKISCSSYQQIIKGFNNVYANILPEIAPSIFGFSKAFLTSKVKSGIACAQPIRDTEKWLEINLGNFSKYAAYQDLLLWNIHFDGMAVLDQLSSAQLASLTLESVAINEEEKMCQILARLQNKPLEEINQYLDQFNLEAGKLAIKSLKVEAIRKRMLSQFVEEMESGFSTFSPANWTHLLSTRLVLFLPSAGEKESNQILSHISGCDSFRAVVSSLSHVYPAISPDNRKGIYGALFGFLQNQEKTTGSACASDARGTHVWLQDNLGAFAAQAPYKDFTKLMATFNGFDIRENLTSTQLAQVFFGTNVLDDPSMVGPLVTSLEVRPPSYTIAFVAEFATIASQRGITFLANTKVRDMMFDAIFSKMQSLFPMATASQYEDWFQNKLSLWLPSINASALVTIPKSVPCDVFKIIISSLDASFHHMSPDSRHDVYGFAKDYLTVKVSQGGDPCTEHTRGSLGWLRSNLGSFSSLAGYKDLVAINPDFEAIHAIAILTPAQLADFAVGSDVLHDSEKAGKVFGSLTSQNIGEFMDAYNAAMEQHQLTQLPNLEMRRFLLGEIFCHLNTLFKFFTVEDYTTWFGERLHLFLSSLDAPNLGFLPSDMSCGSLSAIVKALSNNQTFENPKDILTFIKRVLHFQLQNTGSACTGTISSDREWLVEYFGPLASYGSYSDFTALYSTFRGVDALDLFSAGALAQLSAQTPTIYSSSAITRVFQTIGLKEDPVQFLSAYLDEFNNIVLKNLPLLSNPKVKGTILMLSAEMVFPQMATISLEDTTAWMKRFNLLLPGINGTVLDLLPHDMACPYYQNIVKALDSIYPTLSSKKRHDVYGFQKAYLTAQFADSGSACDGGTTGVRDWLMKNLGQFCSMAQLSELQAFYPELDGLDLATTLSPAHAAELIIIAQMLYNSTLARTAVERVKDFENYDSLHEYLLRLKSIQCQNSRSPTMVSTCDRPSPLATLSPEIQQEFLDNILSFLKKKGTTLNSWQWADTTHLLLSLFLPTTGSTQFPDPPSNETCKVFKETVMEIAVLHPNLTNQQEELAEVENVCFLGTQQPLSPTVTSWGTRSTTTDDVGDKEAHTPGRSTSKTSNTEVAATHNSGGATTYVTGRPKSSGFGVTAAHIHGGTTTHDHGSSKTSGSGITAAHFPESITTKTGGSGHTTNNAPRGATTKTTDSGSGGTGAHIFESATTKISGSGDTTAYIPSRFITKGSGYGGTATHVPGGATTERGGSGHSTAQVAGGDTTETTESGDATVHIPGGATTKGGTGAHIFESATTKISGSGDTTAHIVGGATAKTGGSGDATAHIAGSAITKTSGSGDITVHVPAGATAKTGNTTAQVTGGSITNTSGSGNAASHIAGSAPTKTTGLEHATTKTSGSRNTIAHILGSATTKTTGSGDATAHIPGGATTTSDSGNITTHLPVGATTKTSDSGNTTAHVSGGITTKTIGSGNATAHIPGSATTVNHAGDATCKTTDSGGTCHTTQVSGNSTSDNSGSHTSDASSNGTSHTPSTANIHVMRHSVLIFYCVLFPWVLINISG